MTTPSPSSSATRWENEGRGKKTGEERIVCEEIVSYTLEGGKIDKLVRDSTRQKYWQDFGNRRISRGSTNFQKSQMWKNDKFFITSFASALR